MHPKNPLQKVDFLKLYEKCPEFRPICEKVGNKVYVQWKEPDSLAILTNALLKVYFNLQIQLPRERLVPPVPNRLNYIFALADLINSWIPSLHAPHTLKPIENERKPVVVDVGTGASAIFPLLGAKVFGWNFIATEIDPLSVKSAHENVAKNDLQDLVQIVHVQPSVRRELTSAEQTDDAKHVAGVQSLITDTIITDAVNCAQMPDRNPCKQIPVTTTTTSTNTMPTPSARPPIAAVTSIGADMMPTSSAHPPIAAVMCNPPFFQSMEEANKSREAYAFSTCSGAPHELVYPGGESAFIAKMIEESSSNKYTVLWYTSMLGKKSSFASLDDHARRIGATVTKLVPLIQGRTRRWVFAWTFFPAIQFNQCPQYNTTSTTTMASPSTPTEPDAALLSGDVIPESDIVHEAFEAEESEHKAVPISGAKRGRDAISQVAPSEKAYSTFARCAVFHTGHVLPSAFVSAATFSGDVRFYVNIELPTSEDGIPIAGFTEEVENKAAIVPARIAQSLHECSGDATVGHNVHIEHKEVSFAIAHIPGGEAYHVTRFTVRNNDDPPILVEISVQASSDHTNVFLYSITDLTVDQHGVLNRLFDKLRSDIARTSRKWRRAAAR